MPVAFRYKDFRFFFYSNEGHPREPVRVHVHVHVRSGREALGEDISIDGLLAGHGERTHGRVVVPA